MKETPPWLSLPSTSPTYSRIGLQLSFRTPYNNYLFFKFGLPWRIFRCANYCRHQLAKWTVSTLCLKTFSHFPILFSIRNRSGKEKTGSEGRGKIYIIPLNYYSISNVPDKLRLHQSLIINVVPKLPKICNVSPMTKLSLINLENKKKKNLKTISRGNQITIITVRWFKHP